MEAGPHSFASRRAAAGDLPHFHLPLPNPTFDAQVPRVPGTDSLSPLSSGVNSGSSQSSQPGVAPYNPQGAWSAPAGSSYTFSQAGAMQQHNYSRHLQSPPLGVYNHRATHSPTATEGISGPPSDSLGPPFPLQIPQGNYSHSGMLSQSPYGQQPMNNSILGTQASQPPTPATSAPAENYSRPPPTPSFYATPSSTPQQSSFPAFPSTHGQHSPAHTSPSTASSLSRGIPALSSQPPPMHAPPNYASRPYGYNQLPPAMPVMSNIGNPGSQMSIMGSMSGPMHHQYPAHGYGTSGMYAHAPPSQSQDRPFKCDQCPQAFNRNHDLKRHKKIHLEIKPYPCTRCEKAFSRKDALKRHELVKGCAGGRTSPKSASGSSPRDEIKAEIKAEPNSAMDSQATHGYTLKHEHSA
ncbi:hypothetical protein GGR56DRAFT_442180 [Xylariaceae sp. FL0804]|nr:hypothetical protein GGR56DRAFT_442180 [Xylariaceae sp. FL0804]